MHNLDARITDAHVKNSLFGAYLLGTCFLGFFSPLISYFFSILGLVFLQSNNSNFARRSLVVISLFSFFIIYASRDFAAELREDLSIYYLVYEGLKFEFSKFISFFGGGIEVGWPVLFKIISLFYDIDQPEQLSIINSAICIFLLFIWLEYYLFKDSKYSKDGALVWAFVVVFLGIVTFGYLQRQAISTILVLFSLYSNRRSGTLFFLLASISFHLTAVVFFILYKFLLRYKINRVVLIAFFLTVFMIFFRIYFYEIINNLMSLNHEFIGKEKLLYYREARFSISSYKTLLINFLILFFLLLRWNDIAVKEKNIILFSTFSYVFLAGIPLISERLNFIQFYLLGLFIYTTFASKSVGVSRLFIKGLLILYVLIYVVFKVIAPESALGSYWVKYPYFNFAPLYFLYEL